MGRIRRQSGINATSFAAEITEPIIEPATVIQDPATYPVPCDPYVDDIESTLISPVSPISPIPLLRAETRLAGAARWARSLRRFARVAVWAWPAAAACFAIAGLWDWPTPQTEPTGASPGTWLAVALGGLALTLIGGLALTALLVSTPGRWLATLGAFTLTLGVIALASIAGVVGLARPAVSRLAEAAQEGGDTATAAVGASLESAFFGGPVAYWLSVGGLLSFLLALVFYGWAVLASRVLNRADGWLLMLAVALGAAAANWALSFLAVLAAMVLLAASLGLAWTASRLTADGLAPAE